MNYLENMCTIDINSNPIFKRLSGIVCTIGPASNDPIILEEMIDNGMCIARLNFSHGTHEYHKNIIKNIKLAINNYELKYNKSCSVAIALDTKGSEIRTGVLQKGISTEVELKEGNIIKLTTNKEYYENGTESIIFVDYKNITKVIKIGHKIFIDDGLLCLICEKIQNDSILICKVENGGMLGSCKGVNIPDIVKDLPTISEKDKNDLKFAMEQDIDMVFVSFTRNANEIKKIKQILDKCNIKVIAKIENKQGIDNMDEIIEAADGIMIDRGDLGMEIGTEKIFLAQKILISKCNKAGKPIIIATHFLESMIEKPRPTRAESTDVANAILDGADCVMLSGETAKGLYPVECVKTMTRICREAEASIRSTQLFNGLTKNIKIPIEVPHTIAIAAVEASLICSAVAIIIVTKTGNSARLLSKYKPKCPIIAVTKNRKVAKQLQLYRGILPLYFNNNQLIPSENWMDNVNMRVEAGIDYGKLEGFINFGNIVIIVTGWKQGSGFTNTFCTRVIT